MLPKLTKKNITEINLSVTPDSTSFSASIKKKDGTTWSFPVSAEALSSLFADRFCSGYLPVSQDGVVYIEERSGDKVVVVQRGMRQKEKIKWGRTTYELKTPWTIGIWKLTPKGKFYIRQREAILLTDGPALGAATSIYEGRWLGNVYPHNWSRTNVCWGSTVLARGGEVSVPSLMNILGDFYTQAFTNHIERSPDKWKTFSETGKLPTSQISTLAEEIRRAWA